MSKVSIKPGVCSSSSTTAPRRHSFEGIKHKFSEKCNPQKPCSTSKTYSQEDEQLMLDSLYTLTDVKPDTSDKVM